MRQTSLRLRALVRLVHPFPSILVAMTATMIAALSGGRSDWRAGVIAGSAMLIAQFSVGVVNDLCDTELDALTKRWKPIPSGRVSLTLARTFAATLTAGATGLALLLGTLPTAILALITYVLNLYNIILKHTNWSWVPFALFFPLLPVYSWSAVGHPIRNMEIVLPLGALMGISVHLANSVPDIEGDSTYGAGGIAEWLGRDQALLLSWILLAVVQVAGIAVGHLRGFAVPVLVVADAISVALLAAAILSARDRSAAGLRWNFALMAVSAMTFGIGWAAASWQNE